MGKAHAIRLNCLIVWAFCYLLFKILIITIGGIARDFTFVKGFEKIKH